jgi:pyrophosphatase PpaX
MREEMRRPDLSHIKAILWDLDGTLLDSNDVIAESWQHTVMSYAGRNVTDDEIRRTFGEMLIDSMRWMLPEADPYEALDFYRTYQRTIFLDRISLFGGTEEVLGTLNDAGFKNAIVTSRLKTSTYRALDKFGLTDLFDAVLTADDTEKFKPDPAPLFQILDMIGCKAGEAIFIGDTRQDMEAGKSAGIFTILVDWSDALPPGKIREEATAPDIVIEKLTDIPVLLGLGAKRDCHLGLAEQKGK